VALLAIATGKQDPGGRLILASKFFTAGTVFFSGSLYGLAMGGPRLLGPVTPIGGWLFIMGWLCVASAKLEENDADKLEDEI